MPSLMKISMIILSLICVFGGLLLLPNISLEFLDRAKSVVVSENAYGIMVSESVKK